MIGISLPRRDAALIIGLAAASGAGLLIWGTSPYARWLDHGSAPGHFEGVWTGFIAFNLAWLLMTLGTMLPTALPMLDAFARVSDGRPNHTALTGAVVLGLVAVWTTAGLAAGLFDHGLRSLLFRIAGHSHAPHAAAAAAFAGAGLYQLSGFAERCRMACRSPIGVFARHWTGGPDVLRQSFAIGLDYGRSCFGCCAPLMAVMLVIGMGNLAWMFLLALAAAVQKHTPRGEVFAKLFGWCLVVSAVLLALHGADP
ncbi:DUF2182 domain-containing protein [Microvirga massiliensis]|uniref:DUF2182 domain-containing protein n=1 Tax=Microvirga massiliensis TaxID=1033741 RepID=UPI00065FC7EC|nr:DUF2182 domain-containing protein [Microvirga massiliensis]